MSSKPPSTRTAIPASVRSEKNGAPSQKSTRSSPPKSKSQQSNKDPNGKEMTLKDMIELLWTWLISLVLMIVRFLNTAFEIIADVIVKIYRICLFCYRKPHHAKELLFTTVHLIRVSYDAEIWTWTDMWEVLKSHLITPMTKATPPVKQKVK